MTEYNPQHHHRRSIRLQTWDYRSPGYYFVTICTHQRQLLLEDAAFKEIAADALQNIPNQKHAQHLLLDEWVVMPNHVHAILVFTDYPTQANRDSTKQGFQNALAGSLGMVLGQYKTRVTIRINQLRRTSGDKIWQRGYYEHIIRNEREWRAIQKYIQENPKRWAEDKENLEELIAKMTKR